MLDSVRSLPYIQPYSTIGSSPSRFTNNSLEPIRKTTLEFEAMVDQKTFEFELSVLFRVNDRTRALMVKLMFVNNTLAQCFNFSLGNI